MSESISTIIFDTACKLINDGVRKGEHPLICITAVQNILIKDGTIDERFIQSLINDLADMYFWHPEHHKAIDKKWHTQGFDLYKSYLAVELNTEKKKKVNRKECFAYIEDVTPIQTLLTVCMEECAELQQAISKVLRYGRRDDNHLKQLAEETADVLICIQHIKNLYGNEKEIESIIDFKLRRTVKRLQEEREDA